MSKKCPRCESKNIHITEYPNLSCSMATCYGCGYADLLEKFPEQTLFDKITQSYETLAEKLVYETAVEERKTVYDNRGRGVGVRSYIDYVWKSSVTGDDIYTSKDEAIAATVAKLKEVSNG